MRLRFKTLTGLALWLAASLAALSSSAGAPAPQPCFLEVQSSSDARPTFRIDEGCRMTVTLDEVSPITGFGYLGVLRSESGRYWDSRVPAGGARGPVIEIERLTEPSGFSMLMQYIDSAQNFRDIDFVRSVFMPSENSLRVRFATGQPRPDHFSGTLVVTARR